MAVRKGGLHPFAGLGVPYARLVEAVLAQVAAAPFRAPPERQSGDADGNGDFRPGEGHPAYEHAYEEQGEPRRDRMPPVVEQVAGLSLQFPERSRARAHAAGRVPSLEDTQVRSRGDGREQRGGHEPPWGGDQQRAGEEKHPVPMQDVADPHRIPGVSEREQKAGTGHQRATRVASQKQANGHARGRAAEHPVEERAVGVPVLQRVRVRIDTSGQVLGDFRVVLDPAVDYLGGGSRALLLNGCPTVVVDDEGEQREHDAEHRCAQQVGSQRCRFALGSATHPGAEEQGHADSGDEDEQRGRAARELVHEVLEPLRLTYPGQGHPVVDDDHAHERETAGQIQT